MGAWCEVCDDDGWVLSWGSKMSLTPASAKSLAYQPGLGTVLDSLRERLHPAREQDAVAGPGWHLPVLSYRFEAVGGHTQAGREKPLMQVEQGLWSSCTVYPRSRSVLVGDACTLVPPSLNLPILRQVLRRGEQLAGNQGSGQENGRRPGREPELQPRKGTDRNRLIRPTAMLHLVCSVHFTSVQSRSFIHSSWSHAPVSCSVVIEASYGCSCD